MNFFPDKLYEMLSERAGDSLASDSHTKGLLEQGSPAIIKELIENTARTTEATMTQDLDEITESVGDLWFATLALLLYFGITPDQVIRYMQDWDKNKK